MRDYENEVILWYRCGSQGEHEKKIIETRPDVHVHWLGNHLVAWLASHKPIIRIQDEIYEKFYEPINEVFPCISYYRSECLDLIADRKGNTLSNNTHRNIHYDWRFKNALRLKFDFPAGVGSNGQDKVLCAKHNIDVDKAISLTKDIKVIVRKYFPDGIIDWRDSEELELHYVEADDETINHLCQEILNISNNYFK